MEGIQELAGRVGLYSLSPLSLREIRGLPGRPFTPEWKDLLHDSERIFPVTDEELFTSIFVGGMPFVVSNIATAGDAASTDTVDKHSIHYNLDAHVGHRAYYASYLSSYLERDVRELVGRLDALKFSDFLAALAARTSQLVNWSALAKQCDISQAMAKTWLSLLQRLGIVFLLRPYSNNIIKRTLKTPKVYFYDTGLVCHLTYLKSADEVANGLLSGALFENFVVSEIMKSFQCDGTNPFQYFSYYRDSFGREIDLIYQQDGYIYPIEIKKSSAPDLKRISKKFRFLENFGLQLGPGAVVCPGDALGALNGSAWSVPAWLI